MGSDCACVIEHVAVSLSPEASLVVVMEVVVGEGNPLYVVLAVYKSVVAVLVGGVAVEELAVVYPYMRAAVGIRTDGIGLHTYAVRVSDLYLLAVAPCDNLVLARFEDRRAYHCEAAVADDDIVHALHHECYA